MTTAALAHAPAVISHLRPGQKLKVAMSVMNALNATSALRRTSSDHPRLDGACYVRAGAQLAGGRAMCRAEGTRRTRSRAGHHRDYRVADLSRSVWVATFVSAGISVREHGQEHCIDAYVSGCWRGAPEKRPALLFKSVPFARLIPPAASEDRELRDTVQGVPARRPGAMTLATTTVPSGRRRGGDPREGDLSVRSPPTGAARLSAAASGAGRALPAAPAALPSGTLNAPFFG